MIIISTNNLSLSFGTTKVLDKISFSLEENDKLGIIGVNGSGKTSLFKIITGEYEATQGEFFISKEKSVGILTQYGAFGSEDTPNCTAIEHMYNAFPTLLEMENKLATLEPLLEDYTSKDHATFTNQYTTLNEKFINEGGLEFRSRCASILEKLGFSKELMQKDVEVLSGGQRTRLALAIELSKEPDILMLDEPTNHLDIETLGWLENFLVQYKKCVMVISHDRYFLDRVTNKTLAVENHRAKLYNGGYTKSITQRELDREIQEKQYKDQQKEIARQEAYIAQQRAWNRERNIVAANSRQKALDRMEKIDAPENSPKAIRMSFSPCIESGNDVMYVKNLGMGFGNHTLFSNLNFLVKKRERLLIIGPNGCGKSTFIKLMLQMLKPISGNIEFGYNVEIGYYDQENQNLSPDKTVIDELWDAYKTLPETKIRSTLAWFKFIGEDVFKPVNVLSGGERARLTLAKLILSKMNVLILDEPTNHLDMDSKEALEQALQSFEGTIISVSHDRYFIEKLATRIIEIKPHSYSNEDMFDYYISNVGAGYTEFKDFTTARSQTFIQNTIAQNPTQNITQSKEDYLKTKQNASNARKKAARIQKLNSESSRLELELDEIINEMNGEAATDYKKVAELDTRKNQIEDRLMEIYEELDEE